MNFIKLLPILFLGLPGSGKCKPLEQQLLPSIPGYVPVYIQTGNVPPDVEALYEARKVAEIDQTASASENKEVQDDNLNIKKEKPLQQGSQEEITTVEEKQSIVETEKKSATQENLPKQQENEDNTKNKSSNEKSSDEQKSQENKSSESKEQQQQEEISESAGKDGNVTRKVSQYQVKESQDE